MHCQRDADRSCLSPEYDAIHGGAGKVISWIEFLSDKEASLLGTLAGSSLGLIALLFGALFNARLNRKRDERLRDSEKSALRVALRAELVGLKTTLDANVEMLSNSEGKSFNVPDLAHSVRLFPALVTNIGLLDDEAIRSVADVYILVDQYADHLAMLGARQNQSVPSHRRNFILPAEAAKNVASISRSLVKKIDIAIGKLS